MHVQALMLKKEIYEPKNSHSKHISLPGNALPIFRIQESLFSQRINPSFEELLVSSVIPI